MGNRQRRIPAAAIHSEQMLESIFDNLMNFPGWHGQNNAEWIDMITAGNSLAVQIPHLQTAEEDYFVIEVTDSHLLTDRPPVIAKLIRLVQETNRQSQERLGRSLLYVLFA